MRHCPACGGTQWQPFFESATGRIMTGDQRVGYGRLAKIICATCGVVANRDRFTAADVELLYGEAYELNTLGREEHMFFTAAGPVSRSQVFCDRILPCIPAGARRVVEIGCGEGMLLGKLRDRLPEMELMGLDGSRRAVELGVAKGLDIRQQLLLGHEPLVDADVFILINVIEHVEDIPGLVAQLKRSLRPGGLIIFSLPVQDYGGYDMFFAEHVWHFTVEQVRRVAANNGLVVLASETEDPVNHGIGLFVCGAGEGASGVAAAPVNQGALQFDHLHYWEDAFRRADGWLDANRSKRLAVFGGGEVFTLFYTFTSLGDRDLAACIDDTKEDGATKHGVPVFRTEWLATHPVDVLLLAVNRKYHDLILNKVKPYGLAVYPLVT